MRSVAVLTNPKVVAVLTFVATAALVGYWGLVIVGHVPPPKTVPEVNDEESDSSLMAFATVVVALWTSFMAVGFLSPRVARRAWGLGAAVGALVVVVWSWIA